MSTVSEESSNFNFLDINSSNAKYKKNKRNLKMNKRDLNQKNNGKWNKDEIVNFYTYACLKRKNLFVNFEDIRSYFNGRSQPQILSKFKNTKKIKPISNKFWKQNNDLLKETNVFTDELFSKVKGRMVEFLRGEDMIDDAYLFTLNEQQIKENLSIFEDIKNISIEMSKELIEVLMKVNSKSTLNGNQKQNCVYLTNENLFDFILAIQENLKQEEETYINTLSVQE